MNLELIWENEFVILPCEKMNLEILGKWICDSAVCYTQKWIQILTQVILGIQILTQVISERPGFN